MSNPWQWSVDIVCGIANAGYSKAVLVRTKIVFQKRLWYPYCFARALGNSRHLGNLPTTHVFS